MWAARVGAAPVGDDEAKGEGMMTTITETETVLDPKSFEIGARVRMDLDYMRANAGPHGVHPSCEGVEGTIVDWIGNVRDREHLWFVHWDGMVQGRSVKCYGDVLVRIG
jgi:hypothetical protein